MPDKPESPKVFLSYSWTNEDHMEWVLRLAERLVADGVDVILDRWDLKEGQDKYVFMEQMVTDPSVTRVLAVCDKAYAKKADGRKGGVGTESQIISREVYEKVGQEKFIALVRERDENGVAFLPVFFRSRKYIDFCDDGTFGEMYEQLLRCLFGRPEKKKPPLGKPPHYLFQEENTHVKTASCLLRLKDAVVRQKPHVGALRREYLEGFVEAMEDFRIEYVGGEPDFTEKVLASIKSFLPYRDNFLEFAELAASYLDDEETYVAVVEFFEKVLPYQSRPASQNAWYEDSTDNYRFLVWELFLYWVATLIRHNRYQAAATFMEGEYHCTESLGGGPHKMEGVGAFYSPIRSFEVRERRERLRLFTVKARTLSERAASWPKLSLAELVQADFLLFIRPFFPEPGAARDWWPSLLRYADRQAGFSLFAKAVSKRGFSALRVLLKVSSPAELLEHIHEMFRDQSLSRYFQEYQWHDRVDFSQLLCLNAIASATW
jgi:hypothetical protein